MLSRAFRIFKILHEHTLYLSSFLNDEPCLEMRMNRVLLTTVHRAQHSIPIINLHFTYAAVLESCLSLGTNLNTTAAATSIITILAMP